MDRKIAVVFRTRIAICKRGELATPTRKDPESAVEDWSAVQRAALMGCWVLVIRNFVSKLFEGSIRVL